VTNSNDIDAVQARISALLRDRHNLAADGKEDDFSIRNQSDFLSTLGETTQVFTLLLAGIAAVSLLVGGIGIMNIMLVSVKERTREIGIRKAIGARRRDVLLQFLVESGVLALLGGVLGVLLGLLMAFGAAWALGWGFVPSLNGVVLSFVVSTAIGIFFGLYPAWSASRLPAIEALRYE
ncbi:MAG TPA: FtsX-like permease family protein, partial [Symbiobacteriaceae bacterium]|nr:FtsX-like permease family protein [Symbiobacteriaceae bacterium]